MSSTVRYELVPPYSGFQFTLPDYWTEDAPPRRVSGEICRIDEAGYETDHPEVIAELDLQVHAVRRSAKAKGK